jgi:outer membrane lipoprotein-sorting protein
MKKFLIIYFFLGSVALHAQYDPQAKAILDKVSAKNKSFKTIKSDFTINISNLQTGESSAQKGSVMLKGDKYTIKLPDNEVYFDGKDVYNYLPDSKEVNISKPQATPKKNTGTDIFISNPKDIFKIYQKDFKYKFIKETTLAGKAIYEIDLYPNDLSRKYNRIRMQIDKNSYLILSMRAFFKDGQQYAITFDKFEVNKEIPDSMFTFDQSKYPDAEVIDLRF